MGSEPVIQFSTSFSIEMRHFAPTNLRLIAEFVSGTNHTYFHSRKDRTSCDAALKRRAVRTGSCGSWESQPSYTPFILSHSPRHESSRLENSGIFQTVRFGSGKISAASLMCML